MDYGIFQMTGPSSPNDLDFTWLIIQGQPAARWRGANPGPPDVCTIVLGLTEEQSLEVNVSNGAGKACELVEAVAEHMVRNLGG